MKHIKVDPATGEKRCGCFKRCGGCQLDESYADQIKRKQSKAEHFLSRFGRVSPIIVMDKPYNYRCKVQTAYCCDSRGRILSGVFQSSSGRVTATEDCMLEDERSERIIAVLKRLMTGMKIAPYDIRSGRGTLRHTVIRTSRSTGQIMLVLVTATPVLPRKNDLVKALTKSCPELTTIVQNICPEGMPLTMGDRENVLYGKGYIEDRLCGCIFRISPRSFYQVNPVQTEKLYNAAVQAAGIGQGTRVIDAYCGTGTIGIICASRGAQVVGVESNASAVGDAVVNAGLNGLETIRFECDDAGRFMDKLSSRHETCDVLIMDPPRAGASRRFIKSAVRMSPRRIVYVSCKIETLTRDLGQLTNAGYTVRSIQPVDMFPHTVSIETVAVLEKR